MQRVSGPASTVACAGSPYSPGSKDLLSGRPAGLAAKEADYRADRIEARVVHSLLERDDRVVRDVDVLRAHLGAAFGYVAVADTGISLEQRPAVEHVLRMHLEAGDADHRSGTVEGALQVVGSQDVAHVLAQEAFDAFAKLHHPLDVLLLHPPRLAGGQVLVAGSEGRYLLVDFV